MIISKGSSLEYLQKYKEGKIKLGGCSIVENAPEWYCNKCDSQFDVELIRDFNNKERHKR